MTDTEKRYVKATADGSTSDRSKSFKKGDVIEVTSEQAEALIESGSAVAVTVTED